MRCVFVGSAGLLHKLANLTEQFYKDEANIEVFDVKKEGINKELIFNYLKAINENTFVFSINNPYIIPKVICEKKELTLINLHHSLLPLHPGRNGEAWTIYSEDRYGGITWHYLTAGVDAGDIICQAKTEIDDSTTSLKLLKKCENLAIESFSKEILPLGSLKNKQTTKQERREKINYSYDVPNNGKYNINWNVNKGLRFLNAMNYGILDILGKPYIIFNDFKYLITSYKFDKQINSAKAIISSNNEIDRMKLCISDDYGQLELQLKSIQELK